jgi:hypothetical protein
MSTKKPFNWSILLVLWVPLVFIIGVSVFLSSKDCYQQYCITGWEALNIQWPSFWIWISICTPLGIVAAWLAYKNASGSGKVGQKMQGKDGTTIGLIILALALLCGPWGKGCTDKANGGVTAPGYKKETTSFLIIPNLQAAISGFKQKICDHIYVMRVAPEVKVQRAGFLFTHYANPGRNEGPEIVCIQCHHITKQVINCGDDTSGMSMLQPLGSGQLARMLLFDSLSDTNLITYDSSH